METLRKRWLTLWRGNPPGGALLSMGAIIALVMSIPIVYVVIRSLSAGVDRWKRLLDGRIPQLLWNTISLTVAVTVLATVIGVSVAWIVTRTDIPGKKAWKWLMAIPLLIPPYVGAVTYIIVFGPSGWIKDIFSSYSLNIYSFGGIFLVLTMFTYPYVYLITSASLKKMNRNYEEAAQSLGMNSYQIFWKVILPFLRPAIGAGGILVALYVLSDFGAIAMLRYVTFTAAIYFQRAGFDTESASVLSLVLIAITMVILFIESKTKKSNYHQTGNTYRKPHILPLGKLKPLAFIYLLFIFTVSVALPISVLIYWSRVGIERGAIDVRFFEYVLNSLKVSGIASMLSMVLSVPVIYLKSRYPSKVSTGIERLSYAGYALPGVIVALGFVFIFNNHIPSLYGTFYVIALAFVVRFLPQAMQSGGASLSLISPKIDEAARNLGYPPWKVMIKVILPNMMPGILAGGALVFVSSIKELPATLMLRPPGFDTLALRVYFDAHEAVYYLAAPAALVIVLISIIPLKYMISKY